MGGAMAMRLLDAGFALTVCDPNPNAVSPLHARGANIAATAAEVADQAEIVFASLPALEASVEVALGVRGIKHGRAVRVYIETSTLGTATVRTIAEGLRDTEVAYLDSPVAGGGGGGPAAVRAGLMTILSCGPKQAYERALPALAAVARNVIYLGASPGMAQLAKLINNHISKAGKVAAFEGVVMGLKAGLDARSLIEFINLSTGRNVTTMEKFPAAIFSGTFAHSGPLANGLKDAELYLEEAARLGVPAQVAHSVATVYREAALNGYAELDSMRLIEYMEDLAGVGAEHRLGLKAVKPD